MNKASDCPLRCSDFTSERPNQRIYMHRTGFTPGAVPGLHVLLVAVGHRVQLRQLQRQVQVQAGVVGKAGLPRTGACAAQSLAATPFI